MEKKKEKVLIVASGFSSRDIKNYDFSDYEIVVVNHGWLATDDWNYWVHAPDYKGEIPDLEKYENKTEIKKYTDQLSQYGGHKKCGFSIVLCASYWALSVLKPKVIGYLGCDMNYTPNENGDTHIYGVGLDIQKNGIPDPDRMVKHHGGNNPEFLGEIYNRFAEVAAENGCVVYNFSKDEDSRLPFEKMRPHEI